jgi:hypothetical protein
VSGLPLFSSRQMALFVARGFLRFDAAVPDAINAQFMAEAGGMPPPTKGGGAYKAHGEAIAASRIPEVAAGTPLAQAYASGTALSALLSLPLVAGALQSLLGPGPVFDHHFLHIALPPRYHAARGGKSISQHTHQDSTIDPKEGFDVQLMYYPHAIRRDMGGTRFVPGTHLRKVSETAVGRYQNMAGQQHVVCEAGTLLLLHHGIWHGGGANQSDRARYMFKIRVRASSRQTRRWAIEDYAPPARQRPIFFLKAPPERDSIETILTTPEPWFEQDTGRLEYINRIKLWRYLTEDPAYDADYWMTRLEPSSMDRRNI